LPGHSSAELRHVADAAQNGLISGRMDWHQPTYYVNAVSYRGLISAAELAERGGHPAEAADWRAAALRLRAAWREAFDRAGNADPQLNDDRTAAAGLWPAEVAEANAYGALLDRRWRTAPIGGGSPGRPLWTYFTLAEAHQWLRRDPEKPWAVLRYFWAHQPIPGLYTLWEGQGEENTSGRWRQVRGWVEPTNVTPHYWSAAEMLLLQLAMLAEVEGPIEDRALVIGPGVPASWLVKPFAVKGVGTGYGPVDWEWNPGLVTVHADLRIPVKLGPAFPPGTKLRLSPRSTASSEARR
jgi:hypothetical protein